MIRLAALLVPILLVVGCVGAPVQEMSDARQALQAARDMGAERYVPSDLGAAQLHLDRAEKELELGNYGDARRNALAAKQEAIRARERAQALSDSKS